MTDFIFNGKRVLSRHIKKTSTVNRRCLYYTQPFYRHQTDQKQSDGGTQDEAGYDIRAVITIFGHPLQTCEKRSTQRGQAQHGLCQTTALRPDRARDVHLRNTFTYTRSHVHLVGSSLLCQRTQLKEIIFNYV